MDPQYTNTQVNNYQGINSDVNKEIVEKTSSYLTKNNKFEKQEKINRWKQFVFKKRATSKRTNPTKCSRPTTAITVILVDKLASRRKVSTVNRKKNL